MKGPVAKLLRVREKEAATALEVTAGGRVRVKEGGEGGGGRKVKGGSRAEGGGGGL